MQVAHNMILHDAKENRRNLREFKFLDKETNEEITLYYPDFTQMAKANYLNELRELNPCIKEVPSGALSGNNGLILNDIKKKYLDEKGKSLTIDGKVNYYSKKNPRRSYTYQEAATKFKFGDNHNVFYMNLNKLGLVKVRGWNQKIRFTDSCELNFLDYIKYLQEVDKKKAFTVTIQKDNCNDYWIIFKLADVYINKKEKVDKEIGIDVGIKNIIICSDGKVFENKRFKKQEKHKVKMLNRRLSRRQGWANEEFREQHKKDNTLKVSKRYEETQLAYAKLARKIARKRELYNNEITTNLIENNSFIGTETLNVKGMFRNRHLANALSDVGLYDILNKIEYKSNWYDRKVVAINQWKPSSKRCHCCGYIKKDLKLSDREWICPECNTYHDRDENAATNILMYAKEIV